ncbi:MAG TPA: hypothetical protein VMT72_10375 [Pseudolabrys sp.]|nr:hypothetical protein [Pseudolabrys sp.]
MDEDGFFVVIRVHRDDLTEAGFDVTNVTDEQMQKLAKQMGAAYTEHSFQSDLEIIADEIGIPETN